MANQCSDSEFLLEVFESPSRLHRNACYKNGRICSNLSCKTFQKFLMRRSADCQTYEHKSSSHAFMLFTTFYTFMNVQVYLMALKNTLRSAHSRSFGHPDPNSVYFFFILYANIFLRLSPSRKLNYFIKPRTYTTAVRSLMMQASSLETSSVS